MGVEVREMGSGPVVMLLHGGPSAVADFDPLVASLARDHRVLVPWLPGYGPSPRLAGTYSFARVYELLETMLIQRGVSRLAIVGFSQGAHHALALASSTRVTVERVICLGGYAALSPADRDAMRGFADMLSAPGASLTTPELRAMLTQRFVAPRFAADKAIAAQLEGWLTATTPDVLADELRAVIESDVRPRLAGLSIPIVARVGELDLACPPAYSKEIARIAPNATLQIVDGHGHALLLEQPTETIAAVRAALGARIGVA